MFGPNGTQLAPDPVMTNVVADSAGTESWLHQRIVAVKPVAKDFVRFGVQDAKTLLSAFYRTLRSPGARYNLIPQAILTYLTKLVHEQAVRTEYTEEEVNNSISPLQPKVNAGRRVSNVLNFVEEASTAALLDHANIPAGHKTAATAAWTGGSTSIAFDVASAKAQFYKLSGRMPEWIRLPMLKIPAMVNTTEIAQNASGAFAGIYGEWMRTGGLGNLFGMEVLVGGARRDLTSTGAFTPSLVWDTGNLATSAILGVGGGSGWDGQSPVSVGQFENQLNGTAFEAGEYLSPYYRENGVHIVLANYRRTDPFVPNADLLYAITGI